MDDDKQNNLKNQDNPTQSRPIFESIPVSAPNEETNNLQPEEVAPEIATPEDVGTQSPASPQSGDIPIYEDNKIKYLIVSVGVIFFIVIFFFIARLLLNRTTAPPKSVKLTYWGLWEEKEILDSIIAAYQAKNKHVTIEYLKMSPQEYREKLIVRSKKGQGPDIFRFHNTWLPQITEIIAPLPSAIMTNKEFETTFYPIHQKDLKLGDAGNYNYYGIPLTIDGLVLITNDTLLKKAGIQTTPTNWDEVISAAGKLTVKDTTGSLVTAGIAIGTASNIEHYSDIFGLILLQNGGSLTQLDQLAATEALESYRKFAEDEDRRFWDENMPNSTTAFIQEKVGMIIAPSWEILTIKAANPELKIKVAPIPVVPGGKQISLASYWVEGVSKTSNNQIEAWKFLKYLIEKDTLTKLYENQAKTRLFGEPYSRVDLASSLIQHEYLGAVIQQGNYYVSMPAIGRTFDNGLNDEVIKYLENAINASVQGVAYGEALKTAKQGIDQVFTRYNYK